MSMKSLKNYLQINGPVVILSFIQYFFLNNFNFSYFTTFLAIMMQMQILSNGIEYLNKDKPYHTEGKRTQQFNLSDFIKTIGVNSGSYYIIIHMLCSDSNNFQSDIIYFIPKSFIFEIIFDFFHYWTHRIIHSYPILYRNIHKKHHNHSLIDLNTTYSHNISDYVITNMFPLILSVYLVPMSRYQFTLQFIYKSLVEIGGHSGKIQKTNSFPQFIWLPRYFDIHLTTKEHNNHHVNPMCNFSKRFSLWDKAFGTYKN